MTDIETPTPQSAAPKGSRLLGALGAFLGALLAALITDLLTYILPGDMGRLTVLLNLLLVGWASCWGYRLFRGFRSMKYAQWTVRASIALAQPLALALLLTYSVLRRAWGTLRLSPGDLLFTFARSLTLLLRDFPTAAVLLILGALFFARLSWTGLLKYVDPAWYSDPRRLARVGGGGATFNLPPCWPLPPADSLPQTFSVDKGKLTVEGSALTYKPWAKPRRAFRISDIAGVVLGVSSGYNILYGRDNKELARFAWSRQNALLLGQYLLAHDIPFIDPNGDPIPAQPPIEAEAAPLPQSFTLRQNKLALVVGWLCLLFFGGCTILAFLFVEFPTSLLCGGFFALFDLLALYLLLSYHNHRLTVEGKDLTYTSLWGKTTRFHLTDIARGALHNGQLKLLDRAGQPLASLGMDMKNAPLLNRYLQAHQVPLGPVKPRKD